MRKRRRVFEDGEPVGTVSDLGNVPTPVFARVRYDKDWKGKKSKRLLDKLNKILNGLPAQIMRGATMRCLPRYLRMCAKSPKSI